MLVLVYALYQLSYIGCYTDSWTRTSDNAIISRTVLIAVSIFKGVKKPSN